MPIVFVNGSDSGSAAVALKGSNGSSVGSQQTNGLTQLLTTDPQSLNRLDEIRLLLASINDQLVLSGGRPS